MSGYKGQDKEPTKEGVDINNETIKRVGVLSAKLLKERIRDPSSEKRVVEKLSEEAVGGSVEARANLCFYVGLDLQNMTLTNGIINGRGGIEAEILRNEILSDAYLAYEKHDICGYIALSAIAGYYPPPEVIDIVI
jgi:hypothetical protein